MNKIWRSFFFLFLYRHLEMDRWIIYFHYVTLIFIGYKVTLMLSFSLYHLAWKCAFFNVSSNDIGKSFNFIM